MKYLHTFILMGCYLLAASCQPDELTPSSSAYNGKNELQLCFSTEGLLNRYVVSTRGNDVKTPEEQEIKQLHVFIFDKDGNYLETADEHRFQSYRNITDGKNVMNIDRGGWEDQTAAKTATVIVVANAAEGTFKFTSSDSAPANIPDRDSLTNFLYSSGEHRLVTQLPRNGMPMYGKVENVDLSLDESNNANSVEIPLKALMARIDVSLNLNGNMTGAEGSKLPQLLVTKCEALNVPLSTNLTENDDETTDVKKLGKTDYDVSVTPQTIYNQNNTLKYTFYTYENLQDAKTFTYPEGIKEEKKQCYKPELAAKDSALAFRLTGDYITADKITYHATYTLYLGANFTNNFKVMRNRQYINTVTIKGIQATSSGKEVTFDARVAVEETNPYYVSMLKTNTLDSHFNVVPMDVYLFGPDAKQTMKVEIENPENTKWLRIEKIPASDMEAGTVPSPVSTGGPDLLATGKPWHAGNGKRKYFTTDLVTSTLADNSSVTADANRDRIYFYIDENLDVCKLGSTDPRYREAKVKLTYSENGSVVETDELTLRQARLLEVKYHSNEDEESGKSNTSFYVEAYEEYRNFGDPLEEYASELVFEGLPWGANGEIIGRIGSLLGTHTYCSSNFYNGIDFTPKIMEEAGDNLTNGLDLNTKPKTAAGYCYIKNKRNPDGSVSNPKWYMPGIRELERILEAYYAEYPEFQQNYYWSSAAGEASFFTQYENDQKARATKAYKDSQGNFNYYNSGTGYPYTGETGTGGFANRTESLRIRAARVDADAQ